MIETLGIEYVCSGNGGRSPMAETIGKDYVQEKGLESRIKVYSSGSAVADVENLNFPMLELVGYIEIGLKSGTYKGKAAVGIAKEVVENREAIAEAAENGDLAAKGKIVYLFQYLMADELAKRNIVLLEQGLVPDGHFHQQTVVRDDVELILPMKESNADKVKEIYQGSGRNPTIVPICEYAGIEGAISDPFGSTIEAFRKTRDLIGQAVKKTIDKAIEECLR